MKIIHLFEGRKPRPDVDDEFDDEVSSTDEYSNDEEEEVVDEVENIVMQLRKALDYDGAMPIKFKDGSKKELSMSEIKKFVAKHMNAKPAEKERLQNQAVKSYEDFKDAIG